MDTSKIILLVLLISVAEYLVTFGRRKLVTKHTDKPILILETVIIFLLMLGAVYGLSKKGELEGAFQKFDKMDLLTIGLTSLFTVLITIVWTMVIDEGELSKLQFMSVGLDLFIGLAGGYLLLKEKITAKKAGAFVLLLVSLSLLT